MEHRAHAKAKRVHRLLACPRLTQIGSPHCGSLSFAIGFASVLGGIRVPPGLLGNFDEHGIVFRRQVVGWLLAAHARMLGRQGISSYAGAHQPDP